MKHIALCKRNPGITAIAAVLLLVVIQSTLTGCAATAARKPSGVTTSQAATDIWHSFEVLPNYKYYYSGPDDRPFYIIGIDNRFHLKSNLWKPVDLTPQQLEKWINIPPRVGYSPRLYGADITDMNGQRVGLWYSVRDWRLLGTASVGENNQISVTRPATSTGRMKRKDSYK
jgi:hypothetical protein